MVPDTYRCLCRETNVAHSQQHWNPECPYYPKKAEWVVVHKKDLEDDQEELAILRGMVFLLKEQAKLWGNLTEALSIEFSDEPESVLGAPAGDCAVAMIRRLRKENKKLRPRPWMAKRVRSAANMIPANRSTSGFIEDLWAIAEFLEEGVDNA